MILQIKQAIDRLRYHRKLRRLKTPLFQHRIIDPELISKKSQNREPIEFNEDSQFFLETQAQLIDKKWGNRHPTFINYKQLNPDTLSTQFKIFTKSPEIQILKNVIYLPQYSCLYSQEGFRINESCLYRGSDLTNNHRIITKAPAKIHLPQNLKRISQPSIYVGEISILNSHHGHFLTESISRLWYAQKNKNYPIICHITGKHRAFIEYFFEMANLEIDRVIAFSKPVLLETVILPNPSFVNTAKAFDIHKLLPEIVAKNCLQSSVPTTSQPLYFSRRKLAKNLRLISNEFEFESKLQESGVAIAYPEELSLEQQIYLVNKHQVIMGCMGSALHNIFFDLSSDRNLVVLGDDTKINLNYFTIDAIKSVNSVYISALQKDPKCTKRTYECFHDRVIDVESTLLALRKLNLI